MVALITDVQYRMSLALIRELAAAGVTVYTCAPQGAGVPLGAYSRYTKDFTVLPDEEALCDLLRQIGQAEGCKPALLPVGAKTLALIAKDPARFSALAGLCVPSEEQLQLLNDKTRVAELAARCGVPTPRSYEGGDFAQLPYPLVIKPVCGEKLGLHAAERYTIVRAAAQAQSRWEHFAKISGETPVVQEYLPGGALGCSVLAQEGKIIASLCHRREREYPISGGPSTCCRAIRHKKLEGYAAALVKELSLTGLAMFEFKEDADGKPRLLECNPRIWGSFPLVRAAHSPMARRWFSLAWSAGNPPVTLPEDPFQPDRKMVFFPSDLAAALHYGKAGKPAKTFRAMGDFLNPNVRDGLFEWRDMRPALAYYRSLLQRGNQP